MRTTQSTVEDTTEAKDKWTRAVPQYMHLGPFHSATSSSTTILAFEWFQILQPIKNKDTMSANIATKALQQTDLMLCTHAELINGGSKEPTEIKYTQLYSQLPMLRHKQTPNLSLYSLSRFRQSIRGYRSAIQLLLKVHENAYSTGPQYSPNNGAKISWFGKAHASAFTSASTNQDKRSYPAMNTTSNHACSCNRLQATEHTNNAQYSARK